VPESLRFTGARVIDPASGRDEVADVVVDGGVIAASPGSRATVLDCDGLVLAPGLVDLHTHLRQPGREDKETVASGCRAAAVGGFSAVSPMANTDPVADNAAVIHEVLELARASGACDVFPVGAITRGLGGEEMAELGEMVDAGVRMFSDDGRCVPNPRLLRNALTYVSAFDGVVIAEHCEDGSLAEGGQMHEGLISASLGLAGQPREAEEVVVARDLAIARLTGGRLHLCHLSSAGSVEMLRGAKAEGLRVTAEVTPHHLVFSEEELLTYDTNMKMNPPLRSAADRSALRSGLADGTIDAVRDRPRTSRRRGEGGRVRPGAVRHDRARDRARGGPDPPGRDRRAHAGARDRRPVDHARTDPRRRRSRRADRTRPPRQPGRVRPLGRVGGRAAVRVEEPELRVPRPRAAGTGRPHGGSAGSSSSPTGKAQR
jgi:hypothetical protein